MILGYLNRQPFVLLLQVLIQYILIHNMRPYLPETVYESVPYIALSCDVTSDYVRIAQLFPPRVLGSGQMGPRKNQKEYTLCNTCIMGGRLPHQHAD